MQTEWEMFIHIDGFHRRHNGDHKVCEGKYPMSLWLPGDVVMDDHEFTLEPNFSPGRTRSFFGLFVGESRLKVKSGPNDGDNRVNGGALRVAVTSRCRSFDCASARRPCRAMRSGTCSKHVRAATAGGGTGT